MESHFELGFEKHILPYLRALTQAEQTAAFVIIPHLFILWVASRRWVRLVLYCSSARRAGHGGSFRSKKQESERWIGKEHPSRGPVVNSAWVLPVIGLLVSRTQWRGNSGAKEAKQSERKQKGSFDKCKCSSEA